MKNAYIDNRVFAGRLESGRNRHRIEEHTAFRRSQIRSIRAVHTLLNRHLG